MLDQLTSSQLSEWEAYDRIDPVGSWRDDLRMASIESMMVNIVRMLYTKKGRSVELTQPLDFMPKFIEDEKKETTVKKQSPEEMKQFLLALARRQNRSINQRTTPPNKKKL